jgi:hypothetical protein
MCATQLGAVGGDLRMRTSTAESDSIPPSNSRRWRLPAGASRLMSGHRSRAAVGANNRGRSSDRTRGVYRLRQPSHSRNGCSP